MFHLKAFARSAVIMAAACGATGMPTLAGADDEVWFRNRADYTVPVVMMDSKGNVRGTNNVRPDRTVRLKNGKGKSFVAINGVRYRVSQVGSQDKDDRWFIDWGASAYQDRIRQQESRRFVPPPPPRAMSPRYY